MLLAAKYIFVELFIYLCGILQSSVNRSRRNWPSVSSKDTMNALRMQLLKHHDGFLRFYYNLMNIHRLLPMTSLATSVDVVDVFTSDKLLQHRDQMKNNISIPQFSLRHFSESDSKANNVMSLPEDDFEKAILDLLYKNKDKQIEKIVLQCISIRRIISDPLLKTLLKHYSNAGKPDMIGTLQKYFSKLLCNSYKRNGEFNHYLAKAQCLKGNSDKGLLILRECYRKNHNLRSFYRVIFRELIHDSVMNRSEASLVVFKKYVLDFSNVWQENYPLVCFWHICWLSTWYSDQMLAEELWETSEVLREVVKEKVTALSISALRSDCNEDAVMRLLQTLLRHNMINEYTSVLQVLFNYKLRNKDQRGCAEIVRNCEVLGITLPSDQQGRYVYMLIHGQVTTEKQPVKPTKDFKLKF